MKRLPASWFPTSWQDQAAWFQNFVDQFTQVAILLGFIAADVAAVTKDNEDFQFCAEQTVQIEAFYRAFIQYRNNVVGGQIGDPTPAYPPNPGDGPPNVVDAGILERLDNLVRRIKSSPNYTSEIGSLLGILPESTVRPAPSEMQPTIKATPLPGSVVEVKFSRQNMTGVVLETKLDNSETWSDAGRFYSSPAELVIPTNDPNLPRAVQVRARYVDKNSPVGQYSQVDTVATVPAI